LAWGEVAWRVLHWNFSRACCLDFEAMLQAAQVEPAVAVRDGAMGYRAGPASGNGQGG
jgi:hypothetical protein